MTPRPLWRWWLFCAACWLYGRWANRLTLELLGASVAADWFGPPLEPDADEGQEVPF